MKEEKQTIPMKDWERICKEQKYFVMKSMTDFKKAVHHGFTLKRGYLYGSCKENGILVATSNWRVNGCLYMYFYKEDEEKWFGFWLDENGITVELETEKDK